jgi:hypothetical protein
MHLIVYKITNLINGKIYIGQTKKGLLHRWSVHKAYAKHYKKYNKKTGKSHFYSSIRKYGEKNFKIEVLDDTAKNLKELSILEMFFILQLKTYDPKIGYNINLTVNEIPEDYPIEHKIKRATASHLKRPKGKKSNYHGVSYANGDDYNRKKPWCCKFVFLKSKKTKRYETEIEAAEAYDKIFLHLLPDELPKNFPEKLEEYKKQSLQIFYDNFMENKSVETSKYWGVMNSKCKKYWSVRLREKDLDIYLGMCKTENEAALIHDKCRFFYFKGNINKLNFPKDFENLNYLDFENFYTERIKLVNDRKEKKKSKNNFLYAKLHHKKNDGSVSYRYVISHNSKKYYGCGFSDEIECAKAADLKCIEIGKNGPFNFPNDAKLNL